MKISIFLTFLVLTLASSVAQKASGLPFINGDRILFIGDSITQNGQYVAFIETYLWATQPKAQIAVMNTGVSGETVSGTSEPGAKRPWVHNRLDSALSLTKPTWAFVCYGMNDGNYHAPRQDVQAAYIGNTGKLIKKVKATGSAVVLLSPPPFDYLSKSAKHTGSLSTGVHGYRSIYPFYDKTLVYLAGANFGKHGQAVERFIDIHTPLSNYIAEARMVDANYRYGDGVHPPTDAHLEFALAVLEKMGADRDHAYAVIQHLTGVSLAIDRKAKVQTPAQQAFFKQLRDRFNPLSAAYRTASFKKDPKLVSDAEKVAVPQEKALRTAIAEAMKKMR